MPSRPVLRPTQAYPTFKSFPYDDANAPFLPTDFVYWDTQNKRLAPCGANPTAILGIAMFGTKYGAFDGNGLGNVAVLDADSEVELDWLPSAGYEAPSDKDYMQRFGITRGADGVWRLDSSKNAANQICTVTEIKPARKNPTDTGSREAGPVADPFVVVRFDAAVLTGDATAS